MLSIFFIVVGLFFSLPKKNNIVNSFSIVGTRNIQRLPQHLRATEENAYDDWRSSGLVENTMHLDEDNVEYCLQEFIDSKYGQLIFGCHPLPDSHGITGEIKFVQIDGPEVILSLDGKFWHRRETILALAAIWLNARMPEIVEVNVEDPDELLDFRDVFDEDTGELLFVEDKRSPDFNGDRETMEYQGIDPDIRGPFPLGDGAGFRPDGPMINPA